MKLTKPVCKIAKVYNPHDYASGRAWLEYDAEQRGRMSSGARWAVHQAGKDFGGHWTDYGAKVFTLFGCTKVEAFAEAVAWMSKELGIKELAKTPFGTWMEKSFVHERNAQIAARLTPN